MPRIVSIKAARAARSSRLVDLRVEEAPSIAEAMEDFWASQSDLRSSMFDWGGGKCLRSETKVVDLDHLHSRLIAAMEVLTKAGGTVPGNLWKTAHMCRLEVEGPWRPVAYGTQRVPEAQAEAMIRIYTRLAGWLIAAAEMPHLVRALSKTQGYGVNAKSTYVDLWALAHKFRSPGAFWRLACATMSRTRAVLSAYSGQPTPRWSDVFAALIVDARVGKAAIIAAAMRIRGRSYGYSQPFVSYREARDWLVTHRTAAFSVADETDGVLVRLASEPELEKLGVSVHLALVQGKVQRYLLRFVRKGERSYHSKSSDALWAMRKAIAAWRRQDELRLANANLVSFLEGSEGYCPLFRREDSYRAGNCSAGTESFVREFGWGSREFVPGIALIRHLDDDRVRRVIIGRMQENELNSIAA